MSVETFVTELALTIPALVGTFPVECAGATFATGGVTVGDQTTSLAKAAKMNECMCVNFSQLTFIKNNKGSHEVAVLGLADDFRLPMFGCVFEVHGAIHNLMKKLSGDGPFGRRRSGHDESTCRRRFDWLSPA